MALNIAAKKKGDKLTAEEFNQVVSEINGKADQSSLSGLASVSDLSTKADKTGVYTKPEVDEKVAGMSGSVISLTETEAGKLSYSGKDYVVYRLTAELTGLPATAGSSVDVIISDQPLGDNLFLSVESLSVASPTGFPVSAYKVDRVYVDGDMNTVASVTCEKAVAGDLKTLLTIRYVKGLLSFDTFDISIPLTELGISSADEITVEMPALKYDKKFALSWTTDDSILGIYCYLHKYINKKYIDDVYNYHDGMTPSTGFIPTRILCSTDGCGNDVRFRVDSGWVSYNSKGSDGIHSDSFPYQYVRWSEMVTFLDFMNTAMNHGGGDQTKPKESIQMCGDKLNEKTGYFPYLLLVPGGTTGYPEAAQDLDYIYQYHDKNNLNYSTDSLTRSSFTSKSGLLGRKTYDGMTYEQLCAYIDAQAIRTDHPYIYLGGHVVADSGEQIKWTDAVKPFLDYLYDTYGKGGDDTLWMAGPEEIYEYLFTRVHSVVSKSVSSGMLVTRVKVARLPLFKRYEFSILMRGAGSISASSISIDRPVMRMSSATKDGGLLVNVNYNRGLLEMAEKYTSKYEISTNGTDKDDALYFVGMLSDSLAAPYLARINAGEVAPVLRSVSINSGSSTTYERAVSVTLGVTGPITHYKVSESPGLSGVDWIAGTSKTFGFNLSSGLGTKTVYVQVKNQYGESGVKSSSVTLQERPAVTFTVTGKSNNVSYGTVTPATQEVGQGGTANLTATAKSGYVIESWAGASSSTGVGGGSGTATVTNIQADKTVICNFKKEGGSAPGGECKIILFPSTAPGNVTLPNGDKASQVRSAFSSVHLSVDIIDNKGVVVGKKISDKDSLPTGMQDMSASVNTNPILSGNAGVYPDEYIKNMYGCYGAGTYPDFRCIVRLIDMASGVYTVRVLYSTQKTLTSAQIAGITYEANGVIANPDSGFNPTNNNSQFIEIDNVTIGDDGVLDIYMGNAQAWVRSGWNAIEIEKTS